MELEILVSGLPPSRTEGLFTYNVLQAQRINYSKDLQFQHTYYTKPRKLLRCQYRLHL